MRQHERLLVAMIWWDDVSRPTNGLQVDLSKFPIEKLFSFIAALIPGGTALLVYEKASPGTLALLMNIAGFGYRTKLALLLLIAFVVGNTISSFVGAVINGFYGAFGDKLWPRYQASHLFEVAPWRDPVWRTVLKKHLGEQAPTDSHLMSAAVYKFRSDALQSANPQLPSTIALSALNAEKAQLEVDDSRWAQWYEHYHSIVLNDRDFSAHIRTGLFFNLEATGVYVLLSSAVVPAARHWWLISPAAFWVLMLVAQQFYELRRHIEKWSTLHDQIVYLREAPPLGTASAKAVAAGTT